MSPVDPVDPLRLYPQKIGCPASLATSKASAFQKAALAAASQILPGSIVPGSVHKFFIGFFMFFHGFFHGFPSLLKI